MNLGFSAWCRSGKSQGRLEEKKENLWDQGISAGQTFEVLNWHEGVKIMPGLLKFT